jgi:hypothetical protein
MCDEITNRAAPEDPASSHLSGVEADRRAQQLQSMLEQGIVFAALFRREAMRAMDGSANELPRTSAQLRACFNKLDELTGVQYG